MSTASHAGKQRRHHRIFGDDGRAVIVAMDHALPNGYGPPNADGLDPVMEGSPDAILTSWHVALSGIQKLHTTGLILRIDGGVTSIGEPEEADHSCAVVRTEIAVTLGADAVVVMATPGAVDEHVSLRRLAEVRAECETLGLPVVAEVIPGGFGMAVPWSTENIIHGSRIAVETGADIIKTICPSDPEGMTALMEAVPVPVVVLGGPKMESEDDVVDLARRSVEAGGAGIAFGRNVWGSADPANLVRRLRGAVHQT